MDDYAQADEGYSEAPLNSSSTPVAFPLKERDEPALGFGVGRSSGQFPAWLTQHVANLTVSDRTGKFPNLRIFSGDYISLSSFFGAYLGASEHPGRRSEPHSNAGSAAPCLRESLSCPSAQHHSANLCNADLTMALLNSLPTSVISEIVQQLHPRLYIDFIRYLPPEVCLKILGYLDPVSLIHVARACRPWYELALDRKLWQQLYYTEGWRAKVDEIRMAERRMNESNPPVIKHLQQVLPGENGHARKKRAISMSPQVDNDVDMTEDSESVLRQDAMEVEAVGSSIFGGGPSTHSTRETGISQKISDFKAPESRPGSISRLRGRDCSPPAQDGGKQDAWQPSTPPQTGIPKSALWVRESTDEQYRINWKYLYTVRRRLESNWELGKFKNFQLPHPDYPGEGHAECIYSLQYDAKYLVSGSRDRTLKIWDLETRRLIRTLKKHRGSVLCLQFDADPEEDIIVSGSSDSDVVIWRFSTGEEIQTLSYAHRESVLNVKFDKRILVTCSKDKTIKIFNRRELRYGDLGYPVVDAAPRNVVKYDFDEYPVVPPFTMIGCLEGHSAAVNAVQIHDREVVSASGDRNIKVWDWPTQVCARTIVGHNKGIACVQYDGRRIVSGSSDNEVKVFDRQTGLEVASLRSHSNLVRTVQVGFGDLPYSIEDDAAEAKRVDGEYFKALESGYVETPRQGERSRHNRRQGNAGSKRPEDITAYGAKLPPGGGGGKYGRIVSGSYDTSIIIWRRDKEGIWKAQHHLRQEEAAAAALRNGRSLPVDQPDLIPLHPSMRAGTDVAPPAGASGLLADELSVHGLPGGPMGTPVVTTSPRTQSASAPPAAGRSTPPPTTGSMPVTQVESPVFATLTPSSIQSYRQMIDIAVPAGPTTLAQTLASYPSILTQRAYISSAIDREPSPFVRSQLRQVVGTAMIRTQFEQARQRRESARLLERGNGEDVSSSTQPPAVPAGSMASPSAAGAAPSSGLADSLRQARPQAAPAATPGVQQPTTVLPVPAAHAAAHAAALAAVQNTRRHQGLHLHQVSSPSPPVPATPAPAHHLPHHASPPPGGAAIPAHEEHQAATSQTPSTPLPLPLSVPVHRPRDAANSPRVFKLQYDARRIICCSQTSTIVGWDFCNGDPELEQASRFFAAVQ